MKMITVIRMMMIISSITVRTEAMLESITLEDPGDVVGSIKLPEFNLEVESYSIAIMQLFFYYQHIKSEMRP